MISSSKVTSLRTIFLRKMLWILLPTLIVGVALSYVYATKNILEGYDLNLLDSATDLVHQVKVQSGDQLLLDLPVAANQMLSTNNDDLVIYAVWDMHKLLLSGAPELQLKMAGEKLVDHYKFKNIYIKGDVYRVILLQSNLNGQTFFVSVAQTTRGIDQILSNVLIGFLLLGTLLIAFACIGVFLGVKRSLIPIEALRTAIANRAPNNFQPLPEYHAPSELQPIIHGVNDLLLNLEKSVLSHRRFVADAAHQLRTPLAILRSKLELGINSSGDAQILLRDLLGTTERASRLVSQLLSLSRIENADVILPDFEILDLSKVLGSCAASFVIVAEKNNIDLDFELMPAKINGNFLLLEELINNLIDNAIKYAGPNSTVKISLHKHVGKVELAIVDNGVGIADEFLGRLGQPFFRGHAQNSDGSGLGLAIAKEIVYVHSGKMLFEKAINSTGLAIRIYFPDMLAGGQH